MHTLCVICMHMRTTLNIDDSALKAALAVAKGRTKTDVINDALRAFARAEKRVALLELKGKVRWSGSVDKLRKRR